MESSGEQRKEGAGDVENGDVDVGERDEMQRAGRESKVEIGNDGGGSCGEQGGRDAGDVGNCDVYVGEKEQIKIKQGQNGKKAH